MKRAGWATSDLWHYALTTAITLALWALIGRPLAVVLATLVVLAAIEEG